MGYGKNMRKSVMLQFFTHLACVFFVRSFHFFLGLLGFRSESLVPNVSCCPFPPAAFDAAIPLLAPRRVCGGLWCASCSATSPHERTVNAGWRLETVVTHNRNDKYYYPKGIYRGPGKMVRRDFFDSARQVHLFNVLSRRVSVLAEFFFVRSNPRQV